MEKNVVVASFGFRFVKKINHIDGYKISLTFDDKKTKIVDLENYLDKGIFLLYDADFCADVLYEIGEEVKDQKNKTKPQLSRRSQRKSSSEKIELRYKPTYALEKKSPKKTKS